jgi:tetratricopeptide (TPR) repeat protein
MKRWLGQLVAIPLTALEFLTSIVPIIDRFPIWRAIWALTRNPEYAQKLILGHINRSGLDAGRAFAEEAFNICPDGSIAAVIGSFEFHMSENPETALAWLRRARNHPDLQNSDGLLSLELLLSEQYPEMDCGAIVESILSRNDLPMNLTLLALFYKSKMLLKAGQWEAALEIADRILLINEATLAHWVRWTACSALGQSRQAQQELQRFSPKNLGNMFDVFLASGYLYLGDIEKCREHLLRARQAGVPGRAIQRVNPELVGILSELPPQNESSEAAS